VRSLGGETQGADDWVMVVSPDQPACSGPNSQADRGREAWEGTNQCSGHILGRAGVTKACASRRWSSVACSCGHNREGERVCVVASSTNRLVLEQPKWVNDALWPAARRASQSGTARSAPCGDHA
jgi:hypothetical protein